MRALVLLSSLATGGAERVTVSLVRELAARGVDVGLCTLTRRHDSALAAELEQSGVARFDLGARRLADPPAAARLVRLLRRHRPNVVHAHGQDASVLAALVRGLASPPLVITRHVLEEPGTSRRERLRARATAWALRRADAVAAVSGAVAERLRAAGVPEERVRVLPNGIDLDRFDAAVREAHPEATRRALGLEATERVALLPAVLRPGKGHRTMLQAMPRVVEAVPTARLVVAGGGPLEPELRAAAGRGDTVRLLGHRDDIPALMAALDLVVLPSEAEALPTVLMEAAAAGRAAVATDVGGVREVVEDGRTGLLVPPADPVALSAAVARLLGDPERARSMGEAARERAERRFGLGPYVSGTLDLWRSVIGEEAP